jgi:hypothetical protein
VAARCPLAASSAARRAASSIVMSNPKISWSVPTGTQVSDYRLVLHDAAGVFANVQLES